MPFSQVMNITQGNGARKIVADANGNVFVVYTSSLIDSAVYDTSTQLPRFGKEIQSKVYYIKTQDNGETFSVPEFLGKGLEPAMDIYNSLYFVFLSQTKDTLYCVKDTQKISFAISGPGFKFQSPTIKIDNSEGIHIAVEKRDTIPVNDSVNVKLVYYHSSLFGETPTFELVDEWKEEFIRLPDVPVETTIVETLSTEPLIIDIQTVWTVSPSGSPSISVDHN